MVEGLGFMLYFFRLRTLNPSSVDRIGYPKNGVGYRAQGLGRVWDFRSDDEGNFGDASCIWGITEVLGLRFRL